jgi:hypothetical protein
MEVILMTPNSEHAVELLLGIYEEPKFKQTGKYTYKYKGEAFNDLDATFESYDPWLRTMNVTVTRPVAKEIAVFKEDYDIVNKDNYTEYELTRDQKSSDRDWRWQTITLTETETVRESIDDFETVSEWIEGNEL